MLCVVCYSVVFYSDYYVTCIGVMNVLFPDTTVALPYASTMHGHFS